MPMFHLMRWGCLLLAAVSVAVQSGSNAFGCRYSVRDVAFVNLDERPYRLFVYHDQDTEQTVLDEIRRATIAEFQDANVEAIFVNTNGGLSDDDRTRLESAAKDSAANAELPVLLLESPDQRIRNVPYDLNDRSSTTWRDALAPIVRSTVRDQLMRISLSAHSVTLLVEGTNREQNLQAEDVLRSAIAEVESTMPLLPKPIDEPPKVVTIPREHFAAEGWLLWSLGVDIQSPATQLAMLFGRGRLIGKPIDLSDGIEHVDRQVKRNLGVVGLDCECGLDRSWMQGNLVPHIWTPEDEATAAAALGFDPGSALVKIEMNQILSRGSGVRGSTTTADDDLLSGMQIIDLDSVLDDHEPSTPVTTGRDVPAAEQGRPEAADIATPNDQPDAHAGPGATVPQTSAWALAALAVVALVGSVSVLVFRAAH
ncbi:MAG: hypothetical protein R3E01_31520 [Pirellulaceae bacterium]|nr:hypothetical protein [Planctomycetales bacterium]